jgi:uncharacterized protein
MMKVMFLRFWVLLNVLLWAMTAHAQQQPTPEKPLMGSEASPSPVILAPDAPVGFGGADGVFRILVVGDNLAGGLGAGMSRMVQDDPRYEIVNRFNESSGLSRTEFYDWPKAIEKIVADKAVDAVVILVGVNDRQEIRNGNVRYPFKSPDWLTGYQANIDRMLAAVKAANALPLWVSIPPMADLAFDADMRYLSDIHAKRVIAQGGHFVDVRPYFVAADGSYIDRGQDETGVDRKLRSRDGITFFKQGNNRFGQLILAEINRLAVGTAVLLPPVKPVAASNVATADTVLATVPALGVAVVTGSPSFGQEGLDGEQITFRADAIQPAAPGPLSVAQRSVTPAGSPVAEIKLTAKPGSQAQSLFSVGTVSDAPAGRFDDFAVPALQ